MSTFEEAAREEVAEDATDLWLHQQGYAMAGAEGAAYEQGHLAGSAWARDCLASQEPTEAEVDAAARALNAIGWTCYYGAHEPGEYDDCKECRAVCKRAARCSLLAARTGRKEGP